MHELVLMRHAEAEPAAIDGDDFARALTAAGRSAAAVAARRLAVAGRRIERLLYSPARRTSETAAIVASELTLARSGLHEVPEIYLATPAGLRAVVARWHGEAGVLMLVGHNPSISALAAELSGQTGRAHLPTAGYLRLPLDDEQWRQLLRPAHG